MSPRLRVIGEQISPSELLGMTPILQVDLSLGPAPSNAIEEILQYHQAASFHTRVALSRRHLCRTPLSGPPSNFSRRCLKDLHKVSGVAATALTPYASLDDSA